MCRQVNGVSLKYTNARKNSAGYLLFVGLVATKNKLHKVRQTNINKLDKKNAIQLALVILENINKLDKKTQSNWPW